MSDHPEKTSSSDIENYLTLRPVASAEFQRSLRARILASAEKPVLVPPENSRWSQLFTPRKLAFVGFGAVILLIAAALASSAPAWSKIQTDLRRFFSVTPLTVTPNIPTQFWSDVNPAEFKKPLPASVYSNSLTEPEILTQPVTPSGYQSVGAFILATYPVKNYHSISEILAHTPAEIIRQEPYYDGTLYILRFPGGFLVSYAEFTGSVGGSAARIQSFR